jgi:GT2 family glycosyltransferase
MTEPSAPLVSACIVNWNTRAQVLRCIEALLTCEVSDRLEVIVVDNASGDGSAQAVRDAYGERVVLVANADNRLYAAANNQAFALARGAYVLILNPDAYVRPQALSALIDTLVAHPEAAACAPRLILPDGSVQRSCRRFPGPWAMWCEVTLLRRLFPRTRLFGGYFYGESDLSELREVDQPMTSCVLIRAEDLRALEGFDERFPMFFNDVDLCYRLAERGRKVLYVPEAACTHDHGASTRQVRPAMVAESSRSLLTFYEKHYRARMSRPAYCLLTGLLRAAGWVRQRLAR